MDNNRRGDPVIAFIGPTVDLNDQVVTGVSSEFE